MLDVYRIATVPDRGVLDRQAAIEAADSLGYPVVLKTDQPSIAHKSDVGGVILDLESSAEVGAAFDDLADRLGNRVLVAAMGPPGGVEIALGSFATPPSARSSSWQQAGFSSSSSATGQLGCRPSTASSTRRLIDRLKIHRMLDGPRGQPAADIEAVVEAVVSIAILGEEFSDGLEALDVNPLVCGPWGV